MGVYSNMAAEAVKIDKLSESAKSTDLLEFAIAAQRFDQNMFDSLIELDIKEAYEAKNGIVLTEAEEAKKDGKKKIAIIEKIKMLLKKFVETITAWFNKLKIKINEFIAGNKKLHNKLGDLKKHESELRSGAQAHAFVTLLDYEPVPDLIKDYLDKFKMDWEKVDETNRERELKQLVDAESSIDSETTEYCKDKEISIIEAINKHLKTIDSDITNGLTSDQIKAVEKSIAKAKDESKNFEKKAKNVDDEEAAALSARAAYVSQWCSTESHALNMMMKMQVTYNKRVRNMYLAFMKTAEQGKKLAANSSAKPTSEAAFAFDLYNLQIANEAYCESVFNF